MPDDQHPVNDIPHIDPRLQEFIERIIPILVREYLAQSQKPEAQKMLTAEQRNCCSEPSGTQTEAKSKELRSKDLLTVAEAAAVLVKLGRVASVLRGALGYGSVPRPVRESLALLDRSSED